MSDGRDRRDEWAVSDRPAWVKEVNEIGRLIDMKAVVPLDEASLLDHARRNTGLHDFGADGWQEHFRFLLKCIEEEAELSLVGRLMTRSEFLTFLEVRLQVTEAYKRHPEIEDEEIKEPVFIIGFGRSGTTILLETIGEDPQFRSVQRWESLYPWPAPEEATYASDPRIEKAAAGVEFMLRVTPSYRQTHHVGAKSLIEDIEFTYPAFFSEVWSQMFQIPSWDRYFEQHSPDEHFQFHKRFLKLLQWKFKRPHWLLKNPTHMPRIKTLLKFYPDAKIVLPHRDPIVTSDSLVNVMGIIYSQRSDKVYGEGASADWWFDTESRVKMWDDVIELIEDGTLHKGNCANVLYADFVSQPLPTIERLYADLQLPLDPAVLAHMKAFLDERNRGSLGNRAVYVQSEATDTRTVEERRAYKRYQDYFAVPNER